MLLIAPLTPLIVTSRFGPRPRFLADGKTPGPLHPGVDLRCTLGQDVHAAAAGTVLRSYLSANIPSTWKAGDAPPRAMGYGENVLLMHEDGVQTRYCHLSERLVHEGDKVEAGQVVGQAGNTGYSFGVHLHFEVRGDGGRSFIDPLTVLPPAVIL